MTDRYPAIPGAKGPDGTSQDAAEAIAPCVTHLHHIAMCALDRLGEATVLEAVAAACMTRESLQPRFSELRALGLVEPTGARRRNPSGKKAAVLRLTDKGRKAHHDG
jgi:DNA-binding MarR family transcriptional regulator